MISNKLKAFIAIMIIIFALATMYFVGTLAVTNKRESKASKNNAEIISAKITNYADNYGLLSTIFINETTSLLEQYDYLTGITIQKDEIPFFAYPVDSESIKASEEGNPYIVATSINTKVYTISKNLLNGENLIFNFAFNTILPSEIYTVGRRSFITILAVILTTICVIIYLLMFDTQSTNGGFGDEIKRGGFGAEFERETEDEFGGDEIKRETEGEYIKTKNRSESLHDEDATIDSEIIKENDETQKNSDIKKEIEENREKIDEATKKASEPKLSQSQDPMGLFSSVTGFGFEQYLETRLDAELIRAASSEQDVSLFVLNMPKIEFDNPKTDALYKVILDFFKYRDMVFEYKEDCLVGIVVNMELDAALEFAEELFIKLNWTIQENRLPNSVAIGVTTRTLRLVAGDRLINEAYQASIKALDEETLPIVAFKVNNEKYKEFIAENA